MGEHRYHHRSRHSHDAAMTNDDSSLSGTPRSSARSRTRPMPAYTFWLNTGDNNNNNNMNASFMRLTHAAMCRARVSRSVGRCPRACRGISLPIFSLNITHVCTWASFQLCACVCDLLCNIIYS
jgi:hypothetical protein